MSKQLLKAHQKTDIRFKEGDFIFYEPTKEQLAEVKELVQKNVKITDDMNVEGELAFRSVRFIIRELTNIGNEIDEYTDIELQNLLDHGDKQIRLLMKSITEFINEIVDDIFDEYIQQVKIIKNYLKLVNNNNNVEQMKNETNKLFKKYKIDLTFDDLSKMKDGDEEAIISILDKVNKNSEKKK